MTNSIWADTALPDFPTLDKNLRTDILIIGGGLAGILCAHELHQRGADYALIEADTVCHGVTRNTTAKITSQHGLIYHKLIREFNLGYAFGYYQANEAALKRFRELGQHLDCELETKDNYIFSAEHSSNMEKEWAALKQLKIPARLVKTAKLPFPTTGGICFPNQAQFHPLKFVSQIAPELRIYEHTAAKSWDGTHILTDRGRITANKIIVATHFPMFNKHGGYSLKMYQQRSYVLALENAPQVNGMYLDPGTEGISLRNAGRFLLLGGGSHRTGKQGGGWKALEDFAKRHFPDAHIVRCWATQDCMTLDGVPYIGQYGKNTPNLYVATGFNKWGMTSSMVSAMLLSDLVQGKHNRYAEIFSPQRTSLRPQLFANGISSTANLLTPTTPRCPHLGCALKWNPLEHSWDCPCHGSRFSKDGILLDNPATGNLKKP